MGKEKNHNWNKKQFLSQQLLLYNTRICALREESSQTNVILQYKLLAAILSAVCSVM